MVDCVDASLWPIHCQENMRQTNAKLKRKKGEAHLRIND